MDLTFGIIGAGKVGSVLIHSLKQAGYDVVSILKRDDPLDSLAESASVVGICTPDDVISGLATSLAQQTSGWERRVVFHVSGLHAAEILAPLRDHGAKTLSFHPLSSYPTRSGVGVSDTRTLAGTTVALEGDPVAIELMTDVALRLEARPIRLTTEQKGAYHLAATMASNYLVTLTGAVQRLLGSADLDPNLMNDLVEDTVRNLSVQPPAEALTGPIVRGDLETVRRHLDTLRKISPELIPLYRSIGLETIRLAATFGKLTEAEELALRTILEDRAVGT